MTSISIDRVTLRPGPMSASDARRLAELVGLALGRMGPPAPATDTDTGTGTGTGTGTVSVSVPPQQGRSVEQIADAVARAIEAALRVDGAR